MGVRPRMQSERGRRHLRGNDMIRKPVTNPRPRRPPPTSLHTEGGGRAAPDIPGRFAPFKNSGDLSLVPGTRRAVMHQTAC